MAVPADKLPVEVAEELKWFVWNDIWARVNSRLAGQEEGQRRLGLQKQAKEDSERADSHFRKASAVNAFSKPTLHAFRRQVAAVGSAAAAGAKDGNIQKALEAEVMKPPVELDAGKAAAAAASVMSRCCGAGLWEDLVEAIKNAAAAANMMSRGQVQEQAKPLQAKFEEAWREFEEDVGSYYADEEHADATQHDARTPGELAVGVQSVLTRALASALKWFAWNGIWAHVNTVLAAQREGEERPKRQRQAGEDSSRAEAHFQEALRLGEFSEEALVLYKKQVESIGLLTAGGLKEGNWLLVTQTQPMEGPPEVEERLWIDLVKAVKTTGVAASVMSRQEGANMSFQAEFEEAWSSLEAT